MIVSVDIGYRHLAWVVMRREPLEYIDGGVDDVLKSARKKPTTEQVVEGLTKWIRSGPLLRYPDATIVCESQVGPAVKNRVLSFVLLSHWYPRPFRFVTSSTKVRGMPDKFFPSTVDKKTILQECYSRRKQASVLMSRHIMEMCGMSQARETMEKLAKKDDFGDAFVQAIYFIVTNKH